MAQTEVPYRIPIAILLGELTGITESSAYRAPGPIFLPPRRPAQPAWRTCWRIRRSAREIFSSRDAGDRLARGCAREVTEMSLRPRVSGEVPKQTAEVARLALPKGCLRMRLREVLGPVFRDEDFTGLYPVQGKPGWGLPP